MNFLLTPADGTIRFFDGFKIMLSIKENQNLADITIQYNKIVEKELQYEK